MSDAILSRHKIVLNPMAGEEWCLSCNEPWPCATVATLTRHDAYEAALRRIVEMDTIIDIKEFANDTLAAHGAADLHGQTQTPDTDRG